MRIDSLSCRYCRVRSLAALTLSFTIGFAAARDAAAQVAFDVASVKRAPNDHGYLDSSPPGAPQFFAHNTSLLLLVSLAYGVDSDHVTPTSEWMNSDAYDVDTHLDAPGPLPHAQLQQALQSLLKERFHLKVRMEHTITTGYVLVMQKGGTRLNAAKPEFAARSNTYIYRGGLHSLSATSLTLCGLLSSVLGKPVVDGTGLDGHYAIDLHFAPLEAQDSAEPSLFSAVRQQLGLALKREQVPLDRLTIESALREPTPN